MKLVSRSSAICLLLSVAAAAGCSGGSKSDTSSPSGGKMKPTATEPTSAMTTESASSSGKGTSTASGTSSGTEKSAAPAVTTPSVTTPAKPAVTKPAASAKVEGATHTVTKDEQYFRSMPTSPSTAPDGNLAAGSEVLVLIPGPQFSQVQGPDGVKGYVNTASLKPKQ
jgi:hypothetical protein